MPNNVSTAVSGSAVFATRENGGVHSPVQVIALAATSGSTDVSAANPVPVSGKVVITGSAETHLANIEAFQSAISTGVEAIQATVSGGLVQVSVKDGPAAAKTTDSIAAYLATDAIMSANTALTPKFAKVSALAAGKTTQIAAVAAKKIRVVAYDLTLASAGTIEWIANSAAGTADTQRSGQYSYAANGGISKNGFAPGYFESLTSGGIAVSAVGGGRIGGMITYIEVG